MVLDIVQLVLLTLLVAERLYSYAPRPTTTVKEHVSDETIDAVDDKYVPDIRSYERSSDKSYPTVQR